MDKETFEAARFDLEQKMEKFNEFLKDYDAKETPY